MCATCYVGHIFDRFGYFNLPVTVVAPAQHCPFVRQCHSMGPARRNRNDVFLGGNGEPQLTFCVCSPAKYRATLERECKVGADSYVADT